MNVAVLYGGKSGEHEVSLASAASVVRNMPSEHKIILIAITKEGRWLLQSEALLAEARESDLPLSIKQPAPEVLVAPGEGLRVYGSHGASKLPVDMVFPVLHGSFGEDGTVQGLLECASLPYVGADVLGSALGMDKDSAKRLWMQEGLPVVPFMTINAGTEDGLEASMDSAAKRFGWPMFVKPSRTGSSVGASKISSASSWTSCVRDALRYDTKVIVEPFIESREIECSVVGNGIPKAFEPGEVAPTHEFYDYEAKYLDPEGARLIIPAPISPELRERVMLLAEKAYGTLGLSGMARVDFFLDKNTGELYLNEVNTLPGFTSISMFPKMCAAGGLAYPKLLADLMALALERHSERGALSYERL